MISHFFIMPPGKFYFLKTPLLVHYLSSYKYLLTHDKGDVQCVSHWAQPVLIARILRPKRLPGSKSTWSSSANTSCPLPTISQLESSSTRKLITFLQKNNNTESSLSRLMLFLWCCWKLIKNPKKSKLSDNPGGRNGNFKKFITSLFTSKQQHLFVCVTGRLKLV